MLCFYPYELSSEILLRWRNGTVDLKINPVTWNSYLRQIKIIYQFGIEQGLLNYDKNPCNKLFLKVGKSKRKTLSYSQLNALDFFLQDQDSLPDILSPHWFIQCLVNTFRFTAIRRAQLIRLKIEDIDLD